MPSPLPQPTISGTPLPYPAYGTPAPDVEQLKPKKGVPQSISLADAIRIARRALADLRFENAQWAAIHAKYTSQKQALYPGISANARGGKQLHQRDDGSVELRGRESEPIGRSGDCRRSRRRRLAIRRLQFEHVSSESVKITDHAADLTTAAARSPRSARRRRPTSPAAQRCFANCRRWR